jgi:uncharacterized membrane protein YeiB
MKKIGIVAVIIVCVVLVLLSMGLLSNHNLGPEELLQKLFGHNSLVTSYLYT